MFPTFAVDSIEWWEGDGNCDASGEICWKERPVSGEYNETYEDRVTITGANPSTGWYDWDVTNMVTLEYDNSTNNVSIWVRAVHSDGSPGTNDWVRFQSKESATPSLRPFLNVTYQNIPGEDSCDCAGVDTNWEIDLSDYCVITDACNIASGNITFIGSGNMTCDAHIQCHDFADVGSGNIVWINDQCLLEVNN
jgi:hypothetical protein